MITILHGDDTTASRNVLTEVKKKAKNPIVFYPDSFELANLIQLVEGSSLFESENTILFEEFLSRKKGENAQLLEYINAHAQQNDFYFWESKLLTPTQLSALKKSTVQLFKIPQTIFSFLDSLKPKDSQNNIRQFHTALTHSEPDFLFHMIIRQFRLMIALVDPSQKPIDEAVRLAPWQLNKLKKQADLFGKESLAFLHKKLNTLELRQKTSTLPGGLEGQIDFFLLSI